MRPEPPMEESDDDFEEQLETPLLDVEDIGPVAQRHKSPQQNSHPNQWSVNPAQPIPP